MEENPKPKPNPQPTVRRLPQQTRERLFPNFPHLDKNYDITQLDALIDLLWDVSKNMVGNDDDKHLDLMQFITNHLSDATEFAYC